MLARSALRRHPGHRLANRLRLGVRAGLRLTHREHCCLIDDISSTGARLRVEEMLPRDRSVVIQFHQLRLFGTVMWCRAGECGIRFDRRVEQEDMEGFLWIVHNPKAYARLCRETGAREWSAGLGG